MSKRDLWMSLTQGEQATRMVRTWRNTILADTPNLHTSTESHARSQNPGEGPSRVYTEATAMVDAIEPMVATMAGVAGCMADDVDETAWGTLAGELCSADLALEGLLEGKLGVRGLRNSPSIVTAPVQSVRAWAATVVEEDAGELPASTLHLATVLTDIVSVLNQAFHQEPANGRDQFMVRLFDITSLIDTAARTRVVRSDNNATVPVFVGYTYCEAMLCLRTDGVEDILVRMPPSAEGRLGPRIRMSLCSQHQSQDQT